MIYISDTPTGIITLWVYNCYIFCTHVHSRCTNSMCVEIDVALLFLDRNWFCDDACCMFALYKVCVLVGSECVSFITFYDARLRDRRFWWSSPWPFLFYPRPGALPEPRQAIQMLADNNTYHYLSCMFYFLSFIKLDYQKLFLMWLMPLYYYICYYYASS